MSGGPCPKEGNQRTALAKVKAKPKGAVYKENATQIQFSARGQGAWGWNLSNALFLKRCDIFFTSFLMSYFCTNCTAFFFHCSFIRVSKVSLGFSQIQEGRHLRRTSEAFDWFPEALSPSSRCSPERGGGECPPYPGALSLSSCCPSRLRSTAQQRFHRVGLRLLS